jgi:hypothetical protein
MFINLDGIRLDYFEFSDQVHTTFLALDYRPDIFPLLRAIVTSADMQLGELIPRRCAYHVSPVVRDGSGATLGTIAPASALRVLASARGAHA